MRKREVFFGGGSVVGILSFIVHLLDILNQPEISNIVTIAIFILITALIIIGFSILFVWLYNDSIKSLKNTNKTIQDQLNKLIQSQNNHMETQDERFKKMSATNDTSSNG